MIMKAQTTRRQFLGAAVAGAVAFDGSTAARPSPTVQPKPTDRLAAMGGEPVRHKPFPSWPVLQQNDQTQWKQVLETRKWCRLGGNYAKEFEATWAKMLGARYCLATMNGTNALWTSLNALGIGPGDEVIVPPYTFVATVNVVLLTHAFPVFVDTDRETFQIDANKIETAITPRTKCLLPVHLGGSPVNVDKVLSIARDHKLSVVEDACQAHLAEWRQQKVSTLGDLGCFSFQASKNLNSGEGGAILTNSPDLIEVCESFHNAGRGKEHKEFGYVRNATNARMTEFQAALLLTQLSRLEEQSRTRAQNAAYLTKLLAEIPGISPARTYDGCTRNAYHLYMLRYDPAHFAGLPRSGFLKALEAEGIPGSGGYTPLNKEPFLKNTLHSRAFQTIYSSRDIAGYEERNHCPVNDRLCEEAVWFTQNMLLGSKEDMEQIAEAVRKIQKHASALLRS
jgi:dTDP-4-amino-4,6-dideoxygalactose transaminase